MQPIEKTFYLYNELPGLYEIVRHMLKQLEYPFKVDYRKGYKRITVKYRPDVVNLIDRTISAYMREYMGINDITA